MSVPNMGFLIRRHGMCERGRFGSHEILERRRRNCAPKTFVLDLVDVPKDCTGVFPEKTAWCKCWRKVCPAARGKTDIIRMVH